MFRLLPNVASTARPRWYSILEFTTETRTGLDIGRELAGDRGTGTNTSEAEPTAHNTRRHAGTRGRVRGQCSAQHSDHTVWSSACACKANAFTGNSHCDSRNRHHIPTQVVELGAEPCSCRAVRGTTGSTQNESHTPHTHSEAENRTSRQKGRAQTQCKGESQEGSAGEERVPREIRLEEEEPPLGLPVGVVQVVNVVHLFQRAADGVCEGYPTIAHATTGCRCWRVTALVLSARTHTHTHARGSEQGRR